MKIAYGDIIARRDEYKLALKTETQAAVSVRMMWRQIVGICDELLQRRENDAKGTGSYQKQTKAPCG